MDEDKRLVTLYLKGDIEALRLLVEKYKRALYGYLINMLSNKHDADDLFQDIWLKIIKKLPSYKSDNFKGWIMKIAHNTVIDNYRKKRKNLSLDYKDNNGGSLSDTLTAKEYTPYENISNIELGKKIKSAVGNLPKEQREVFIMRTNVELSFKEISSIQKTSINTSLARMQYAVNKLRAVLKGEYSTIGRSQ